MHKLIVCTLLAAAVNAFKEKQLVKISSIPKDNKNAKFNGRFGTLTARHDDIMQGASWRVRIAQTKAQLANNNGHGESPYIHEDYLKAVKAEDHIKGDAIKKGDWVVLKKGIKDDHLAQFKVFEVSGSSLGWDDENESGIVMKVHLKVPAGGKKHLKNKNGVREEKMYVYKIDQSKLRVVDLYEFQRLMDLEISKKFDDQTNHSKILAREFEIKELKSAIKDLKNNINGKNEVEKEKKTMSEAQSRFIKAVRDAFDVRNSEKKNCQRAHISGRSNKRDFWHSTSGKGTSKSFRKRYKNPDILCESSLSEEWKKLLETCPDLSVEREQAMASKRRLLDRLQAQ